MSFLNKDTVFVGLDICVGSWISVCLYDVLVFVIIQLSMISFVFFFFCLFFIVIWLVGYLFCGPRRRNSRSVRELKL